ncbi:MAG: hypothetical protein O3A25_07550 [Acidobacteria bacterium]|nr:hypothetical protein [Acidobacteriota bacterium]
MTLILNLVVGAHVIAGVIGLGAFWIPVFARKGGVSHRRFGAVYANCAYLVTGSAVIASLGRVITYQSQGLAVSETPERYGFSLFLGYLGIATFAAVRQSMRAVQTRRRPETLRTPTHLALAWVSIAGSVCVILFALTYWSDASTILLALSPVGIFTGARMLQLMRNPGAEHMGWFYSHMGSMLGGGIAFHTAFAVFGLQRVWDYSFAGALGILPWILPTLA